MRHSKLIVILILGVLMLANAGHAALDCEPPSTPGMYRLCKDFENDVPGGPDDFCPRTASEPTDPAVQLGDVESDGQFVRVLYDGEFSHFSSAAFDLVASGAFPRIIATFDFRLGYDSQGQNADGFSFLLIPTLFNGTEGCSLYGYSNLYVEEPKVYQTFGVGFDVYHPGLPDDQVHVCWARACWTENAPFQLDTGKFHRATIDIRSFGDDSLVSVTLIEDVYGPALGTPTPVFSNFLVPGMQPYENRIDFAGRNGGFNMNQDVDNIDVLWWDPIVPALSTHGLLLAALLLLLLLVAKGLTRRT